MFSHSISSSTLQEGSTQPRSYRRSCLAQAASPQLKRDTMGLSLVPCAQPVHSLGDILSAAPKPDAFLHF